MKVKLKAGVPPFKCNMFDKVWKILDNVRIPKEIYEIYADKLEIVEDIPYAEREKARIARMRKNAKENQERIAKKYAQKILKKNPKKLAKLKADADARKSITKAKAKAKAKAKVKTK